MPCTINGYENFLMSQDCDRIIKKFGSDLATSTTVGEPVDGYRTSENVWIGDINDPIIRGIMERLASLVNVPSENQETPNLIKYEVGQQYKEHHDFFFPDNTSYYHDSIGNSGQRTHTAILYLNDDYTGGETRFPELDFQVTPKKGMLCIWNNINQDGSLEGTSLHAGLPVTTGRKWILIIWIREKKFC